MNHSLNKHLNVITATAEALNLIAEKTCGYYVRFFFLLVVKQTNDR